MTRTAVTSPGASARAKRKAAARSLPDLSAGRVLGPRHREVLDHLETIILSEGFRDLTVGALARRMQCSRRTLYEIADSKEELVLLVVDRVLRRVARHAHEASLAEPNPLDALRAYLLKGLVDLREATVNFSEDVAEAPAVQRLVNGHFALAGAAVAAMVADGIDAGEFAPVDPWLAAEAFNGAAARVQEPEVLRRLGLTMAEAFEQFFMLFADGLRGRGR